MTRRISSRLEKEGEGQVEEREDAPVWMPVQPYASSSETSDDDMTESPAPPYCVRYEGEREPSNSHRQPELRRSAAPVAEDEAKPTHLLGDVDVEQALGVRLLDDLPRVLRGREESAQAQEGGRVGRNEAHLHGAVVLGGDRDDLVGLRASLDRVSSPMRSWCRGERERGDAR